MNSSNGRFTFTPTEKVTDGITVPFLEDATADVAPYYSSYRHGKREVDAQQEVIQELLEADAEYQRDLSDQGKAHVQRYLAYRQYFRKTPDDQAEILAYNEWLASGAADNAEGAT